MKANIRWGAALGGALIAETTLIAVSFVWVAIYSYLINPGQPLTVYEQHAQLSGPWVSIVAGLPIFYAVSRWIARNRPTALTLWCLVTLIDAGILAATAGTSPGLPLALIAASYCTKLLACLFGSQHAPPRTVTSPT